MTDVVQTPAVTPETKGRSLFQLAAMRFKRNRAAMAGCVMLALIAVFSFLGPLFSPHTYDQVFPSSGSSHCQICVTSALQRRPWASRWL